MVKRIIASALAAAAVVSAVPAAAQSRADDARFAQAQARFQAELARFQSEFNRYQSTRGGYPGGTYPGGGYRPSPAPQPGYYDDGQGYYDERDEGDYDPSRYYRAGPPQTLNSSDRVYAGNDGRYYCKRNDGTTGLIVGGAAGGVLGNVIDGGHSRILGTLLGGAAGALAGKAVEQSNKPVVCR